MQLVEAHVLRRGRVRRSVEEGGEVLDVTDIILLRLLQKMAHSHVFDHAPAQRTDGLLGHRGAPVLRWRLQTPQSSGRDTAPVTTSRSAGNCLIYRAPPPRAAPSRESGFVLWPEEEVASPGPHEGRPASDYGLDVLVEPEEVAGVILLPCIHNQSLRSAGMYGIIPFAKATS